MERKEFIGLTSVSKTIRNELIPVPATKKYIKENGLITEDELRNEKSQEVKEIADDYYRDFIARKLADVRNIDWIQLFDLMKVCKADPSKDNKKALSKAQETARKQLCTYFSNSEEFNKLFCAKLFTDLLPNFINSNEEYSAEEKIEKVKTVELFNRFYTYFKNFLTSRENMFSAKEQVTAIGYRVINENAVIFLDNLEAYNKIKELAPQEISKIEQESSEEFENWTMDQIFTPYFYGMFTTQENITHFNKICGVINQHMNLYCQQTKEKSGQFRMRKLHKQILSETISLFEVPRKFEDDAEVLNAVNAFITNVNNKNVFEHLRNIVKSINNYDFNKIYIAKDSYSRVSNVALGRWNVFKECLEKYYDEVLPGKSDTKAKKKKITKAVNDDLYKSINDFDMIVNHYHTDSVKGSAKEIISEILKIIPVNIDTIQATTRKISEDDKKIDEIKEKLDVFINVLRWTKIFQVNENLDLDASFYSEVENISDELEDIVPLYNKVRNYVTKKPFSLEKIKLNFNCPSLGSGWSQSKEFENNCTILMRDGKYYLMVFNALNKPKKKEFVTAEKPSSDKDYKKMTYNLLANAYMTLPHIFIKTESWLEKNNVSNYIVEGFNQKRHIKSSKTFDIKFCRDLIDYFKDCINKYPGYDAFKFKFSDTDSYNDISGFYREVDEQGYAINWSYIKEETINTFVESGKVFLFQIYNKDFSEKSTGKKNLHTMYFENLFSEENLRNTVLRLNGGAEIFFRKSSIKNPVVHKKGTVYVNKTIYGKDMDGSEIRVPIPDDIYMNIYNHYNKGTELSSEAEALINTGKVEFKDVEKEITKDYRYTIDKFFLHLPILINGKVYSKKTVNDLTLQYIKENNINVLGICRGSNNMLYASVINQNGELIEQKSFNVVHNFDYKKKLDDRERSMDSARKNWKEIGKIKELEEGYLSNVVHEVVKLMMRYNAIIALEDVSVGKRKTKLDARVFQKFQKMLINKLNYLTSKDIPVDEDGGLLRGYQLTYVETLGKLGRQCGFLFFTTSSHTNIDPTTGFVSLFDFKEIRKNNSSKLNFLLNFDEIAYDSNKHMFKFAFDYTKMTVYKDAPSLPNNKWTVYTNGTRMQRVYSDNKVNYKYEKVDITSHLIKVLCETGINYSDGHNLLIDLNKMYKDDKLVAELFETFTLTVQMRNMIPELQEDGTTANYDRFISPVLNNEGNFFDTYNYNDTDSLPCCADALTAYCIALKGLYEVKQVKANWTEENFDRETLKLAAEDWLNFITTKKI